MRRRSARWSGGRRSWSRRTGFRARPGCCRTRCTRTPASTSPPTRRRGWSTSWTTCRGRGTERSSAARCVPRTPGHVRRRPERRPRCLASDSAPCNRGRVADRVTGMRVLFVHPSPLIFSEIYLRLEPLGLEMVAAAAQAAGHDVRLLDLQASRPQDYSDLLTDWRPEVIGFSLNYLANVPEVIDLSREAKSVLPGVRVFVGGHSASFIADDLLGHADGAIDCVVRGEGEGVDRKSVV